TACIVYEQRPLREPHRTVVAVPAGRPGPAVTIPVTAAPRGCRRPGSTFLVRPSLAVQPARRRPRSLAARPPPRPGNRVFESLRDSLRDLWHGSRTPEE